jgi:hypothetical protein
VTIVGQVGHIESPGHVAMEVMEEALECDVAEGFALIERPERHAYMKVDALLEMDGTRQRFFQAVHIRRKKVVMSRLAEEHQFPHLAARSAGQEMVQADGNHRYSSEIKEDKGWLTEKASKWFEHWNWILFP